MARNPSSSHTLFSIKPNLSKKEKTRAQRLIWWGWVLVLVPIVLLVISYGIHFILPEGGIFYKGAQSLGKLGIAWGVALSPFGVLFLIIGSIKRLIEKRK